MDTNFESIVIELHKSGLSARKISQVTGRGRVLVTKILKANNLKYIHTHIEVDKVSLFWSKLNKNSPNGCWEWTGYRDKKGYGEFRIFGDNYRTHRVAYLLTNGEIPNEMFVCHKCDNPPCCNPDHLFLGTNQDNMIDCILKERKPNIKLTPALVKEIRAEFSNGIDRIALMEKYKISRTTLNSTLRGEKWAFVK